MCLEKHKVNYICYVHCAIIQNCIWLVSILKHQPLENERLGCIEATSLFQVTLFYNLFNFEQIKLENFILFIFPGNQRVKNTALLDKLSISEV